MKSVLLGNGIDIQFGGKAYLNRFIMSRIIFNAITGKSSVLFNNELTGEEIVAIFKSIIVHANNLLAGKYDDISDKDLSLAIQDFKRRFRSTKQFRKYYEVPLEDWFFLMKIHEYVYHTEADISSVAKQGIERLILDAIYNEGKIQELHQHMGKKVRRFFNGFENIFTLNYDNNIEKLCNRPVYHLHGDFSVLADSENPDVAQGFCRVSSGQAVTITGFEHCFCNALLNFSGDLKYHQAGVNSRYTRYFEGMRQLKRQDVIQYQRQLDQLALDELPEVVEWVNAYCEHPALKACTDYHFSDLISLSGELHIIGMSPHNDSHIFRCIEESNIEKVFFYRYDSDHDDLPLSKPVEYEDAKALWKKLDANKPTYNCKTILPDTEKAKYFISLINGYSFDPVSRSELLQELKGIPSYIGDGLCEEALALYKKLNENGPPKDEIEVQRRMMEVGRIALREGIYPSALLMLLGNYMNAKNIDI